MDGAGLRVVRVFLIQAARSRVLIDWRHVEKATWKMPSKRQRKSDNIHVYACILLHIEIEAKLRPRMCVRFVLRFLASAFSKLNPCISPSLFFFFVIRFLLREFFFFSIQSSLNECRAVLINHDTRSSHMSLHPHNLLSFVIRYDYIWREIIIPLSAWSKINRHSLACFFNYDYNKYSPFNNSIGRKSKFVKLLL